MPNITLYGTPQSTYVRTVRLLLAETVTTQTPKLKTWWDKAQNLASVKNVCA